MSDPQDAHDLLTDAIIAKLTGFAELQAYLLALNPPAKAQDRVSDSPIAVSPFPSITVGDGQSLSDRADDYDGENDAINVHVWSQEQGLTKVAKQIARIVRRGIDGQSLDIGAVNRLVQIFWTETRYLRDPDGITSHAVVMFEAFTEPA